MFANDNTTQDLHYNLLGVWTCETETDLLLKVPNKMAYSKPQLEPNLQFCNQTLRQISSGNCFLASFEVFCLPLKLFVAIP